jgi:hypothetical protein
MLGVWAKASPWRKAWAMACMRLSSRATGSSTSGVVNSNDGYMNEETTTLWGLESTAGIDLVRLPFAAGLHAPYGFTNRSWRFIGLHVKVRI